MDGTTPRRGSGLVDAADALAADKHRGQVDKAGRPYIEHPRRVAARLSDAEAQAVALLHDVLEDTDATPNELRRAGMPDRVVEAVLALTKRADDESYDDAVRRAAAHPLARQVKAADVADNADEQRLALLDEDTAARLRAKYARARQLLTVATGTLRNPAGL